LNEAHLGPVVVESRKSVQTSWRLDGGSFPVARRCLAMKCGNWPRFDTCFAQRQSFIQRQTVALIGGIGLKSQSEDVASMQCQWKAWIDVDVRTVKVVRRKPGRLLEPQTKLASSWFTTSHMTFAGGVSLQQISNARFKLLF
jgi:hypothetical protein